MPETRARALPLLHVDWTRCDGHGSCVELLPELLERDDWGFPAPRRPGVPLEVPPDLRAHAVRAVEVCPLLALRLLPPSR